MYVHTQSGMRRENGSSKAAGLVSEEERLSLTRGRQKKKVKPWRLFQNPPSHPSSIVTTPRHDIGGARSGRGVVFFGWAWSSTPPPCPSSSPFNNGAAANALTARQI